MRICVFGAGATGGHFATRLALAGHDVSVVARGAHLQAILRNGLTLVRGDEKVSARVKASENPADLGPQDVVIVGVKATGLKAAADAIGPLLTPETLVVFPQNGMAWWYPLGLSDNLPRPPALAGFALADTFLKIMDESQIVGGSIYSANEVEEPGVVVNSSPNRNLLVVQSISDRRKLVMNASGSSLGLAAGVHSSEIREDPELADAYRRVCAEMLSICRAHGYPLDDQIDAETQLVAMPRHKPSILQDYERGRPMEIAEMLLAPLEFGRAAGLETPSLATVVAIVSRRARDRGLYGG